MGYDVNAFVSEEARARCGFQACPAPTAQAESSKVETLRVTRLRNLPVSKPRGRLASGSQGKFRSVNLLLN
jgi:hypothetical protein